MPLLDRHDRVPARRDPVGDVRAAARWAGEHALTRAFFEHAARSGELFARIDCDPALRADPYPAYEELRSRGRIVPGRIVSATADHALTTALLRHPDVRVGAGLRDLPGPLGALGRWGTDPWAAGPIDPPSLLAIDGVDHARLRRLVNRAFTARQVRAQEDLVTATAERLLDRIERSGAERTDLVDAYAAQLPVAVIGAILGVPERDHRQLLAWGNSAASLLDPGLRWGRYRRASSAVRALHRWVTEHVEAKRRDPGDDLLSQLALLDGDGDETGLTDLELRAVALLVLAAGFETTVNLISNAVVLLERHREQRDRALAEPDLWAGVVEETLRFDPPVQNSLRVVPHDLELEGVAIAGGTPVLLFLAGANRDPAVFDDPHVFDSARPNANAHLAFSSGAHYCLGAALARAEARIALRMLHERFPDLRVDGEPVRRETRVLRGFERLPVTPGRVPART
ncbi:cytochrome P450 [Nocardioides zeae]